MPSAPPYWRCTPTECVPACHKTIAAQIAEQGGDYLLALKGNHPALRQDVERLFDDEKTLAAQKPTRAETVEKDHGRIETRSPSSRTPRPCAAACADWPRGRACRAWP